MKLKLEDGDCALVIKEDGIIEAVFPEFKDDDIIEAGSPTYIIMGLSMLLNSKRKELFSMIEEVLDKEIPDMRH